MAFCLDAQFGFLHMTLFKTCHLSAQVYRTRYTLHGFLFHFFCAFVCKRVFSHIKSSRLLEVTSRVNSCRVVTTRRHFHPPFTYCMAFCLDAQFGFLHMTLFKTCHLSAQVYRTRYTLHGFLFHFFCAFVCKRVFSHIKSSRLLEVTSRVNSCRVVTTRRHFHPPFT